MTATERAGFLAHIHAEPDEDTHRLVYADALRESDDPFDRAHGAFIWAGVTLVQFRGHEPATDGMFFDAVRAQADAARRVIGAQVRALFTWPDANWAWDNDASVPDRCTARLLPPAVGTETASERRGRRQNPARAPAAVWERGMIHTLRLPLADWVRRAEAVFGRCPVRRVEVLDVPGLTLHLIGGAGEGWRLGASLDLPAVPRHRPRDPRARGAVFTPPRPAANLFRVRPSAVDAPSGLSREQLRGSLKRLQATALFELRDLAGDRWPGPPDPPAQDDLLGERDPGEAA